MSVQDLIKDNALFSYFLKKNYEQFSDVNIDSVEDAGVGKSGDNLVLTASNGQKYFASFARPTADTQLSTQNIQDMNALLEHASSDDKLPPVIKSKNGDFVSKFEILDEVVEITPSLARFQNHSFTISPLIEGEYGDLNHTTEKQSEQIGRQHAKFLKLSKDVLGDKGTYQGEKSDYNPSDPAHFTERLAGIIFDRYKMVQNPNYLSMQIDLASKDSVLFTLQKLKKKEYKDIIKDKEYQDLLRVMCDSTIAITGEWKRKAKAGGELKKFKEKTWPRGPELNASYAHGHLAKMIVGLAYTDDVVKTVKGQPTTVIHGDPNPSNFVFDKQGDVKLFGDLNKLPTGVALFDVANAWANMGRRFAKEGVEAKNFEAYTKAFIENSGDLLDQKSVDLIKNNPEKVLISGQLSFAMNRLGRESNPDLSLSVILGKMAGPTSAQYIGEFWQYCDDVVMKDNIRAVVMEMEFRKADFAEIKMTGANKGKNGTRSSNQNVK